MEDSEIMMKKALVYLCAVMLALLWGISHAQARVKVYLDKTRTDYIMADELDCKVYEKKSGITIGFKAGTFLFGVGPEFTLGEQNAIEWDKAVKGVIARYKELCTRFNSEAITLEEYNERIEKIDTLAKEMAEFQQKLIRTVKEESEEAFDELDKETKEREKIDPYAISRKLYEINSKIKMLPE